MRLPIAFTVLILVVIAGSASAHAAGPVGNWTCRTNTGLPAGGLSLSDTSYGYSPKHATAFAAGRARIDGDMITIVDGPLGAMGISFGWYATGPYLPDYFGAAPRDARSQLTFSMGPGRGLLCSPDPSFSML